MRVVLCATFYIAPNVCAFAHRKIAKAEATKKVQKEFATFDTNNDGLVTWTSIGAPALGLKLM